MSFSKRKNDEILIEEEEVNLRAMYQDSAVSGIAAVMSGLGTVWNTATAVISVLLAVVGLAAVLDPELRECVFNLFVQFITEIRAM